MSKQKLKVVRLKDNKEVRYEYNPKSEFVSFTIKLVINTIVIMLAANLFKGMSVTNFWYAMIAALIIAALNQFIRPFLVAVTLPLTIITFGLFYPFINVIILQLTSLIMSKHFQVEGVLITLLISFFISFMNYLLESLALGRENK